MNYALKYNLKYTLKYKLKYIIVILVIFTIILFFSTFNTGFGNVSMEVPQANFQTLNQTIKPGTFKNSYKHFDGSESVIFNVNKGNKMKFNYNSTVKDGVLSITINDPNGVILANLPVNKRGSLNIIANGTGKIKITVLGKNTSGSFQILWKQSLF